MVSGESWIDTRRAVLVLTAGAGAQATSAHNKKGAPKKGAEEEEEEVSPAEDLMRERGLLNRVEKREHQPFGKEGFEGMVEKVASLEKTAGLCDRAQFTTR